MSSQLKPGATAPESVSEGTSMVATAANFHNDHHVIEVADENLTYRSIHISDLTPTGQQLATAAGFKPTQSPTVLHVLPNGELEDIRPDETINLHNGYGHFIIVESDRLYRFTIDGVRFDWPCRMVSGELIRKLGKVPVEMGLYFERKDEADRLVNDDDLIDLDALGVEAFYSRKLAWSLNVQGVMLEILTPTISVRDALTRAGFDPNQGWQIFLKIAGQPKQAVELSTVVDLRTHGIEKLRLTPREVNNGEAAPTPRRDFALLDVDEAHLGQLALRWETVVDEGRRWLLIHSYDIPQGYTAGQTLLALEIPQSYPGAQIDMFYTNPPLALESGRPIDCTQVRATIFGIEFHGWSRHRGAQSPWNPSTDNVITHLALVESALAKEVGE
ncbi:multiubiquitin domain-containing protein [Paludibacterium sp. B53371]|uniref:multiubiquitin domain-containing protein n=1 Tax=Paludibacterium sp. B53371 TaxID=2806263 RepID=UPI001C04D1E0|nr:multiubiquitin domain-containing protein [Paludibacterium sp. B53371]